MKRDVVDKWCGQGILLLALAILVFGPLAIGGVDPPQFLVLQGLTLGVMALWLARLWLSPRPRFLWPPICWAVAAFVLYAIVRYLTADIEYVARLELIRVLVYAFLFLAVLNNLHRQESAQAIVMTLVFLAMAVAGYAIYQFVTGSDRVWHFVKPYPHRGSGTFISPDHLAGFLEQVAPLGLACTLVSRAKTVTKVLLGYASIVILAGIGVTVSRGGWFSTAAALIFLFVALLVHRNHRLPALVMLIVIVGIGLAAAPRMYFLKARLQSLPSEKKNVEADTRFALWRSAVRMWRENIWWGVGPGHYDYRFRQYRPPEIQLQPERAHNDFLNTLTDWGIVGAGLVAAPWALLCAGIVRTWRFARGTPVDLGARRSNKFALLLGASAGLLAILCHSAVDFNMHVPANAILTVTLMALTSGYLRFATERYWRAAGTGLKVLATLVLACGVGYLGVQEWRRANEYVWIGRAARLQQAGPASEPEAIAALEKASAAEPSDFETTYAIGEAYRIQSWERGDDYRQPAQQALPWYQRGMKLNPYDGYNYLRYGMCLDRLGRAADAGPYFEKADELDPNGYYTAANVGWHYVQLGDYAAARVWCERSLRLFSEDNPIASSYLQIATGKMLEHANNTNALNLDLLAPP